ncbi:hypothetical protein RSOL_513430, partial [Rhizoctonia solani AG-3 Rhs1AP]
MTNAHIQKLWGSLQVIINETEIIAEALPVLAPRPVARLEAMRRQLDERASRSGSSDMQQNISGKVGELERPPCIWAAVPAAAA